MRESEAGRAEKPGNIHRQTGTPESQLEHSWYRDDWGNQDGSRDDPSYKEHSITRCRPLLGNTRSLTDPPNV